MITISPLAEEKLAAYLSENNIDSPVRIAIVNDCSGPSLGLALDEQKNGDIDHSTETFTLLVAGDLAKECGAIEVDYVEEKSGCGCNGAGGFTLKTENPLPSQGGGCGGSCSSGCGC